MADLKIQQLDPLEGGALAALDDADLFIVKMKRRGTAIADEDRKVPWSQVKLNLSLGDYMPTIGGVFTGSIIMNNTVPVQGKNSANANRDLIKFGVGKTNANSVIVGSVLDALQIQSNAIPRYFDGSTAYDVITKKNLPAPADINAYSKTEVDAALALKLDLTGGSLTGNTTISNNTFFRGLSSTAVAQNLAGVTTDNKVAIGSVGLPLTLLSNANPVTTIGANTYTVYHTGNKPTASDVGTMTTAQITAADALKLNLTGGTLTGKTALNAGMHFVTQTGTGNPNTAVPSGTEVDVFYSGLNSIVFGDVRQPTLLRSFGALVHNDGTASYTVYTAGNKPSAADVGAATPADVATAVASSYKDGGLMSASLYPDMLGNNSDFGIYYQTANAGALTSLGYPTTSAGTLLVTKSAYGCQQEYTTFGGVKFTRGLLGNFTPATPNWRPWVKQYSTGSVPTPAEIGVNTNAQNDARFAFSGINADITALNGLTGALKVGANATDPLHVTTLQQVQAMTSGTAGAVVGVVGGFIGAVEWFNGARAAIPAGWAASDGQLLNRADYPDVWAAVNSGALNNVTDALWLDSGVAASPYSNRSKFSNGNGTTTFRMPDLNGAASGSISGLFLSGQAVATATPARTAGVYGQTAPNITGAIAASLSVVNGAGQLWNAAAAGSAIYEGATGSGARAPSGSAETGSVGIRFNAARADATYGRDGAWLYPDHAVGIWIIRVSNSFASANTDFTIHNGDTALPATGTQISGGALYSRYDVSSVTQILGSLQVVKTVGDSVSTLKLTAFNKGATVGTDQTATMSFDSAGKLSGLSMLKVGDTTLTNQGLELYGATPTIDFHYGNDTGDYTHRIIADTANRLNISSNLNIVGSLTAVGALTVNGLSTFTNNVTGTNMIVAQTYASEVSRVGGIFASRVFVGGAERAGLSMYANTNGTARQGTFVVTVDGSSSKAWTMSYNDGSLTGSGPYNNASDMRIKTNLQPVKNALDAVCSWHGVTFDKKDSDKREVGLLAQEIEKDCPEAITTSRREFNDGSVIEDLKSVNLAGVSAAYHTEAIKELAQMVRDLQAEVARLKA